MDALKKIGLTDGEIKVYLTLLETGSATTWTITKKSKISGSKVYEVLERLIEKGLASSITKNNVKYFEAANPNRIIDYLNEKQEQIEKEKSNVAYILPQLLMKAQSAPKSDVKVFVGFEGLKTANEDIIQTLSRGEEWLSMGLSKQPKSWEIYFTKRQKARADKGIILKHLINEKYKSLYESRKKLKHTQFRFLPKNFEMPTSTEIYSNKVIIMILSPENPTAILIENKDVADSFKKYFYALWNKS